MSYSFFMIPNLKIAIPELCDIISNKLKGHHIHDKIIFHIHLVIDELLTNIVLYAYPKDEFHWIEIGLIFNENELLVQLKDSGIEFDPTTHTSKTQTSPITIEDTPIGGLGIKIAKYYAKNLHYKRDKNQNILTIYFDTQKIISPHEEVCL